MNEADGREVVRPRDKIDVASTDDKFCFWKKVLGAGQQKLFSEVRKQTTLKVLEDTYVLSWS